MTKFKGIWKKLLEMYGLLNQPFLYALIKWKKPYVVLQLVILFAHAVTGKQVVYCSVLLFMNEHHAEDWWVIGDRPWIM